MQKIAIKRAHPKSGVVKVSLTMLFRHEGGFPLDVAKRFTDAIVDDEIVTIEMENLDDAVDFMKKASELGVICEIVEE